MAKVKEKKNKYKEDFKKWEKNTWRTNGNPDGVTIGKSFKLLFVKLCFLLSVIIATLIYSDVIKEYVDVKLSPITEHFHTSEDIIDSTIIDSTGNVVDIIENDTSKKDINKAILKAVSYLGTPYVWGGKDSTGIDCSGLIYQSYRDLYDIKVEYAQSYALKTIPVHIAKLEIGDLIFFIKNKSDKNRAINHVAIYLGNDVMIHAVGKKGVIIQPYTPYYKKITEKIGRFE